MGMVKVSLDDRGGDELAPFYDLVVIGAGPAGLTAGMYAARARINHIVVEKNPIPGGQIVNTESVENYPGFDDALSGFELMEKFRQQAEKFGANIKTATVSSLKRSEGKFIISTDAGETTAEAVIVASGSSPMRMNIPGEEEFIGHGVSFCATCDGALYRDKIVAVIGGGDAGIEEGMFLTRFASKVIVIEMMDHLGATKILQERAAQNEKMEIILSHKPVEIVGDRVVAGIVVENLKSGEKKRLDVDGVFVYIGVKPNVDFISIDGLELDRRGFIVTDDNMSTGISGLFAAGDVRSKLLRQVSTAVGDGATAAFAAQRFLEK